MQEEVRGPLTTQAHASAIHFSAHRVVRSGLAESLLLYEITQPAYCSCTLLDSCLLTTADFYSRYILIHWNTYEEMQGGLQVICSM